MQKFDELRMETERLFLRHYTAADKSDLIDLFTDADVMKYVDKGVMTEAEAVVWWEKLFAVFYPQKIQIWGIWAREDSRYLGHAGIYPRPTIPEDWEFVYFFKKEAWGFGYATESARRLARFGLEELNLPEVYASVDDDHSASIRVLEKAGLNFARYEYDDEGRFSVYWTGKKNAL